MVTKLNNPTHKGIKPLSMNSQSMSNLNGPSYDKGGKLSGKATGSWFNPVQLESSVTMNRRPEGGPVDGAHPNAKVHGKGGVSSKG